MRFIQRDHMIQHFLAGASDPPLGSSVLPWSLDTRPLWLQSRRLQDRGHRSVENRVVVENHVSIRRCFGKRLAQLLDHPLRSRVAGHVEMEDLPASMCDQKKQYRKSKVSVGTVKKSNDAIASRWFWRNAGHRLAGSPRRRRRRRNRASASRRECGARPTRSSLRPGAGSIVEHPRRSSAGRRATGIANASKGGIRHDARQRRSLA